MAFDMYLSGTAESIDHHEEGLFAIANEAFETSGAYPDLCWLWGEFYDGPKIDSQRSGRIVHELIALRSHCLALDASKSLTHVIDRLLPFFSRSYVDGVAIETASD